MALILRSVGVLDPRQAVWFSQLFRTETDGSTPSTMTGCWFCAKSDDKMCRACNCSGEWEFSHPECLHTFRSSLGWPVNCAICSSPYSLDEKAVRLPMELALDPPNENVAELEAEFQVYLAGQNAAMSRNTSTNSPKQAASRCLASLL